MNNLNYPNRVDTSATSISEETKNIGKNDKIKVRYSLKIYLKNKKSSDEVTVIMMNPSKANKYQSDRSVNKVINFVDKYMPKYSCISIVNILPFYGTRSKNLNGNIERIIKVKGQNYLDNILNKNIKEIKSVTKESSKVIMAWGRPYKFSLYLYYDLVHRVISILLSHDNLYVFKMKGSSLNSEILTLEKNPRHPAYRTLLGLVKVNVSKRYGIFF